MTTAGDCPTWPQVCAPSWSGIPPWIQSRVDGTGTRTAGDDDRTEIQHVSTSRDRRKTRVVNVRNTVDYDVYIGRANPRRGLRQSPFVNPFVIGPDGDRNVVLARYRQHLRDHPELVGRARRELRGKTAGRDGKRGDGKEALSVCRSRNRSEDQ